MSKISDAIHTAYAAKKKDEARHSSEIEINFMNGESYTCDPLTTLKLVTASSIYGEPAYYRASGLHNSKKVHDSPYRIPFSWVKYTAVPYDKFAGMNTSEVMEKVIDEALDYDFAATLNWAVTLRKQYNMRLNPQVIMVRAAIHPKRKEFTAAHPGMYNIINQKVMQRADDPLSQLSYYIFEHGSKNDIPSILKRSIASKLSSLSKYQVAKYKNHEIGMKNATFITHAFSPVLDELVKTDKVQIPEEESTWENMRSAGADWKTIFNTVDMGHMAMLRNLRGVFSEVDDSKFCADYLNKLKSGVRNGKQFPFRYWSAYNAVKKCLTVHHKPMILDALNECIDLAKENVPHLKGKTIALSDNSGSAWETFSSEYGKVTVADIDNLSSVMLASVSDEGYVGVFGNELTTVPISRRDGILTQAEQVNEAGKYVGKATENGIWLFFRDAIDKKEWWDNIVIFSDQQAGHGGLYGTQQGKDEYIYRGFGCPVNNSYINVMDLILEYRKEVNPKANVMSVQTAGYCNSVIPQNIYRGTIAYGWTGQEAALLKATSDIWDEVEANM